MDDILKNSLSGLSSQPLPATPKALQVPDSTGSNDRDIAALGGAQQKPSDLLNLQKALQVGSSESYKQRQATEMGITAEQFDPTKVSGGTFASIIGNLEQKRGMDISKVYASTMNTYVKVQEIITDRLQFLQNLEEQKRQFKEEMKMKEKEYERLKENDKEAAEQFKETMEEKKREFDLTYAKSSGAAAKTAASAEYTSWVLEGFKQIHVGDDGNLNPNDFNTWWETSKSQATDWDDFQMLSKMADKFAVPSFNPEDTGYRYNTPTPEW